MKIIGLSGRKQSGKDTLFALLKESLPDLKVERVAFADALKQEVAQMLGVSVLEIEQRKSYYRPVLQWYGQWRRDQNPNYWIDRVHDAVGKMDANVAVVTDVRHENESAYVRNLGGIVCRVNRHSDKSDTHISETEVDRLETDLAIDNTGTLEALKSNVQLLARIIQLSRQ